MIPNLTEEPLRMCSINSKPPGISSMAYMSVGTSDWWIAAVSTSNSIGVDVLCHNVAEYQEAFESIDHY
jgi:hypothetical protein